MFDRKKLPIGIDGFQKIRTQNFYYIDKTAMIRDLLLNWGEVNLITRPRRFGKSLNMSMLKCFLEIGCDCALFDGLQISREERLCEAYMGQFPVISITLKSIDRLSFEDALSALREVIGREALRFSVLAESKKLSDAEKGIYHAMTRMEDGLFTMSSELLMTGLQKLSALLAKHYNRKTVILIDEYDVPLDKAFQSGYYDEMVSVLRNLFGNALKSNEDLQFAVLTGCMRISKESIFTGLNNLKVHSITDARYDAYFGFTDKEIRELLDYYGLSEQYEVVKEWYDGYKFGRTSLYCPWDVFNYCSAVLENGESKPENYWANTSGNAMVRRFIDKANQQTKREIEQLIEGETIGKTVNMELTYNELDTSVENLWSVLFTTGYLTKRGRTEDGRYLLAIPNTEIRSLFISQIRGWFDDAIRADVPKVERFCKAFPAADAAAIDEILNDYLWNSIGIRDTSVRRGMKENFYHGILLGLLQYEDSWLVKSNAESGEGFSDILIETPERIGIVIEVKYSEDGNLAKGCEKALAQIEDKDYAARLREDGMRFVVKYGIAFYKKQCKVVVVL